MGLLGAAIAVYLFQHLPIPEFRQLWDTSEQRKETIDLRLRIDNRRNRFDEAGGLASDHQLKDYTERLAQLERGIQRHQWITRVVGFALYLGIGGLVAGLVTDDITVEGVGDEVKAAAIGASWTSYLAALGLRGEVTRRTDAEQSVASTVVAANSAISKVEQRVERIEELPAGSAEGEAAKREVVETLKEIKNEAVEDLVRMKA